jgi:hypothetical protein
MTKPHERSLIVMLSFLAILSGVSLGGVSHAQRSLPLPPPPPIIWPDERPAEPARWTQEDVTPEQKYETARKESVAAQQVAVDMCKTLPQIDQAVCLAQTRLEYAKEMADIKARFGVAQ